MGEPRKGLTSRPLAGKKTAVKAGAAVQRKPVKNAKKLSSAKPVK